MAQRQRKRIVLDPHDAAIPLSEDEEIGMKEIAEIFGVDARTPTKWRRRGLLPKPIPGRRVSGREVYSKREIVDWGRKTGRIR